MENMAKTKKNTSERIPTPEHGIFYNKSNYILIIVGLLIVVFGFLLMSGGENAAEQWDDSTIYSFRRITLAPIIVISGLSMVIYAIFKTPKDA